MTKISITAGWLYISQAKIKKMIDQLCQSGYLKVIGGQITRSCELTPQGEAAIKAKSAIPIKLPRQVSPPSN